MKFWGQTSGGNTSKDASSVLLGRPTFTRPPQRLICSKRFKFLRLKRHATCGEQLATQLLAGFNSADIYSIYERPRKVVSSWPHHNRCGSNLGINCLTNKGKIQVRQMNAPYRILQIVTLCAGFAECKWKFQQKENIQKLEN